MRQWLKMRRAVSDGASSAGTAKHTAPCKRRNQVICRRANCHVRDLTNATVSGKSCSPRRCPITCRYPRACCATRLSSKAARREQVSSTNPAANIVSTRASMRARKSFRSRSIKKKLAATLFCHSARCSENGFPVNRMTSKARTTRRGFCWSMHSNVTGSAAFNSAICSS